MTHLETSGVPQVSEAKQLKTRQRREETAGTERGAGRAAEQGPSVARGPVPRSFLPGRSDVPVLPCTPSLSFAALCNVPEEFSISSKTSLKKTCGKLRTTGNRPFPPFLGVRVARGDLEDVRVPV